MTSESYLRSMKDGKFAVAKVTKPATIKATLILDLLLNIIKINILLVLLLTIKFS